MGSYRSKISYRFNTYFYQSHFNRVCAKSGKSGKSQGIFFASKSGEKSGKLDKSQESFFESIRFYKRYQNFG